MALRDDKLVLLHILIDNIPRLAAAVSAPADVKAPALSNGGEHQTVMAADCSAVRRDDIAGLGWQIML